jgi:hypothetical protein
VGLRGKYTDGGKKSLFIDVILTTNCRFKTKVLWQTVIIYQHNSIAAFQGQHAADI